MHEVLDNKVKSFFNGVTFEGNKVAGKWFGERETVRFDQEAIRQVLEDTSNPCFWVRDNDGRIGVTDRFGTIDPARLCSMELLATLPAYGPEQLGDPAFRKAYGTRFCYMAGAMANGIASEEMVITLGKSGFLGSFGAGGLVTSRIEKAIDTIQRELPNGPYAFNLIHSPMEESLERNAVELYLRKGVHVIEASAYLGLTEHLVRYRASGLRRSEDGRISITNKIIAKVSRLEVASVFLKPAPEKILRQLTEEGKITLEQAELAALVPMADDITVEADSGGHTDRRSLVCLLPAIAVLRDQIMGEYMYTDTVRIGAAGGISTPQAVVAAFAMGAAYVVTGSINQSCREAGTSDYVRKLLAGLDMTDVAMAPAADMFETGVKLQVARKGTLFSLRAQKLYDLYINYPDLESIPEKDRITLEKTVFKETINTIWENCQDFFSQRDPEQIVMAQNNPKRRMALVFRWYLGLSSVWANSGTPGRELDAQIWCGPSMGSFNQWVKGSYLDDWKNRHVTDLAFQLLSGAVYLSRLQGIALWGIRLDAVYKNVRIKQEAKS